MYNPTAGADLETVATQAGKAQNKIWNYFAWSKKKNDFDINSEKTISQKMVILGKKQLKIIKYEASWVQNLGKNWWKLMAILLTL